MAYRNTFFRWLFLYSLTFGLTYVLKLFTYLCPETGQILHRESHWSDSYTMARSFLERNLGRNAKYYGCRTLLGSAAPYPRF